MMHFCKKNMSSCRKIKCANKRIDGRLHSISPSQQAACLLPLELGVFVLVLMECRHGNWCCSCCEDGLFMSLNIYSTSIQM